MISNVSRESSMDEISQVLLVEVQHPLRASSVDDGQFCFRAIKSAIFVLRVPDDITPQLAIRILACHSVDGLD